jgi:hypothetical protein
MVAALSWPLLAAMRDGYRRRCAVGKLPYATDPSGVTEPYILACGATRSHDLIDDVVSIHQRQPPVATDQQRAHDAHCREVQAATPWYAAAANACPYDTAIHDQAVAMIAASHDAGTVSIDQATDDIAVVQGPASTAVWRDEAASDSRAAESRTMSTLVAASERAASMVMSTPTVTSILALLTIDGVRDEVAVDALVCDGTDAPSHEQPDDADRGRINERDWWDQAVVVIKTPASIITLRSGRLLAKR